MVGVLVLSEALVTTNTRYSGKYTRVRNPTTWRIRRLQVLGAPQEGSDEDEVTPTTSFEPNPLWLSTQTPAQKLRRGLYNTLVPLDRGDFRWEFLVPWLPKDKMMTRTEKFIVFSVFIAIALIVQDRYDKAASISGHLGYIAQFFSFAIGNPIGYRLIAIGSSFVEIIPGKQDAIPIIYNLLFLPINLYYVLRWVVNNEELLLNPEEELLYTDCFEKLGFKKALYSRLLRTGVFITTETDTTLCIEGEELRDLFVVVEGACDVVIQGTVTTQIRKFDLIGEASLLENLQSPGGAVHQSSRASIVAQKGVRYVRWKQSDFYELQETDKDFAYAIQLMIARTLSKKLRDARISQQELQSKSRKYILDQADRDRDRDSKDRDRDSKDRDRDNRDRDMDRGSDRDSDNYT